MLNSFFQNLVSAPVAGFMPAAYDLELLAVN